MRIQFTKMTGAGNDFVVIDNRQKQVNDGSTLAPRLCDRRWGIGADGLLLLEPSVRADYRMTYFNADGSYGGMCGNGGRCIASFATSRGIAPASHRFDALDYIYAVKVDGGAVELAMKDPKDIRLNMVLPISGKRRRMHFVDTGAPHVVLLLGPGEHLEKVSVEKVGRRIRFHKRFVPDGTNVNFVKVNDDKSLSIRTYERGVETETYACGTGSIAGGIIAFLMRKANPPVRVLPKSGVELSVNFEASGGIKNVRLIGPAKTVFEGYVDI